MENDVGTNGLTGASNSATPPTPPPSEPGIKSDMADILKGVQLPERVQPDTSAEKPKKVYDTQLPGEDRRTEAAGLPSASVVDPAIRAVNPSTPTPTPKTDVPSLHTLKDDLQEVVRDKKISVIRAAALEEQKRTRISQEPVTRAPQRERMTFSIVLTLVFLCVGALAIGAVYVVMQDRSNSSPTPQSEQLLFAEQTVPLPIDGLTPGDVKRTLASARNSGVLTLGAIFNIVPILQRTNPATNETITEPATFSEFLRAIGARAPDELTRALSSEFFLGLHTVDESAPLLVIPVTSYERAFAAMLSWERNLNDDLQPFFTDVPSQKLGSDGLPVERTFEDDVMRNYDVRTLKDDSGTIQLYYSFPTRNILIIAESPYSFAEILSRLRADRQL